jgi:hypothetical protein
MSREHDLMSDLEAMSRDLMELKSILKPHPGQTLNNRARQVMALISGPSEGYEFNGVRYIYGDQER